MPSNQQQQVALGNFSVLPTPIGFYDTTTKLSQPILLTLNLPLSINMNQVSF